MMQRLSSAEHAGFERAQPLAAGLRVAIVSDAAPERNGVGAYYRDLAEHLKAVGAQVDLISPRFRRGSWYGGLALPLPGDSTQKLIVPSLSMVSRRIERMEPDAVIIPTPGPYGMLGMRLAKKTGANLVVGFHTHYERLADLYGRGNLFSRLGQAYLYVCNRMLFKESSLVLANSSDMVEVARELGAEKVSLMGTPIPLRFLEEPVAPLGREVRRVLFAGRLAPEKNLEAVVEAARDLPELQFQVAGEGPLRGWLVEQAGRLPNLEYLGWVKRSRLLPLIDGTDILVLPSRVESFGTIALEAMARARLVLVSSECGILDWGALNRGLFQVRPHQRLSEGILRITRLDHALRQKKAMIAREAAREINDWNLEHWLSVLLGGTSGR